MIDNSDLPKEYGAGFSAIKFSLKYCRLEKDERVSKKGLTDYRKIILLTDGFSDHFFAKTAISLLKYRSNDIVAVLDKDLSGKTAGEVFGIGASIPVVHSLDGLDADALFIGIAPPGGKLPESWRPIIANALARSLDIVSGLHSFLSDDSYFQKLSTESNTRLIDVRKNSFQAVGSGNPFDMDQLRVLTVGQDCSVGKMVTTLEVQKHLLEMGHDAGFAASGQTGIMISGHGIPIDCIVSDFLLGACEQLVERNSNHSILLIEGQGSITHPAYSPVTLGLIHGTLPQAMILCYEAGRKEVKGFPKTPLHSLKSLVEHYQQVASIRNESQVIGVGINSRTLNDQQYEEEKKIVESELGLPACDVYRDGAEKLANAVLKAKGNLK